VRLTHPRISISLAALLGLVGVSVAAAAGAPAAPPDDAARFFSTEVRPVLEQKCVSCHSGEKPQGNLRLTTRQAVLNGGNSGSAVPLIVKAINFQGRRMPPQGKISQKEIDTLTKWVEMGLPWATGEHASLEPKVHHGPPPVNAETRKFWSFQPVKRPAVPAVKNKAWVRNPIDAFILAKLEAKGLQPNPPADRAALIRRAYYNLTGLPPTPEEVQAFAADRAPNAWEKVVDRLLASPRYGERWGRHWLDLVRFAESNSYERDGTKPFAWRYRDYVIDAFNNDKPYDQFITEQLAGDELAPRTPERLIATGYYRLGIWDDEPVDPLQALYDDLDDVVATTGQVFLGMTVNCARCHDHKLDPIPTKDYYRLLAFFNGMNRYGIRSEESVARWSLRPLSSEGGSRLMAEKEAYDTKVRTTQEQIDTLEAKILPDLQPVEKEDWRYEYRRVALAKLRVPRVLTEAEFSKYQTLTQERSSLRRTRPKNLEMALCVTEIGAKARDTFVLHRGNAHATGDKVEPGFLSVLPTAEPSIAAPASGESSGRRLALAKWIGSPQNPLTARVMVNRVWQYHFGRGIVRSSNNFGFQGDLPTHRELIDWLASYFAEGAAKAAPTPQHPNTPTPAWSLKKLHRLILLSNAYRMSSRASSAALVKDPENDLFWRFDMRRLGAEEVRDSVLAANGSLNLKMGGPSIYTTIPQEVLAGQSMPGAGWGNSTPEEQCRRSVYIFVKRSLSVPIIASFDGADTDFTCPVRFATTQPTQALGMLNSTWTNDQAKVFAAYLRKTAGEKPSDQVRLALWRVLQRAPAPGEIARGAAMIEGLQREDGMKPEEALAVYCLMALNLNEFVYLD